MGERRISLAAAQFMKETRNISCLMGLPPDQTLSHDSAVHMYGLAARTSK